MFKSVLVVAGSAIVFASIAGCATITKGTTQAITLDTPGAAGSQCTLTSSTVGKMTVITPATVTLDKGQDNIKVSCKKECYSEGVGIISSNVEGMAAGNILVGGVIGLGIDAASGAMNKYSEQNQIAMVPTPGCRAKA
jgi:hypothetical protein